MTKPNEFTMNTDYLTIARTGRQTFNYYTVSETVAAGGQVVRSQDFTIAAQKGAIDSIQIKKDSEPYMLGRNLSENVGTGAWVLDAQRTSSNTFHVEIAYNNLMGSSSLTFPAMSFTIKVTTFKPPNVF